VAFQVMGRIQSCSGGARQGRFVGEAADSTNS
jgi:hypothetical protein